MAPRNLGNNVVSWATDLDENTAAQAARTAQLPFLAGHLALMPDAHYGIGATIGSVIPTEGAIVPAACGVDLGCGVIAAETDLSGHDLPDSLDRLHRRIAAAVPAGVGKGHDAGPARAPGESLDIPSFLSDKQARTAIEQFGTLGSGNHFVEVCVDERDRVWALVHSGSRGIGNQLAQQHIEGAKRRMKEYVAELPDPDLAYLTEGTPAFDAYIEAMLWAQDYARGSRETMMSNVLRELFGVVGHGAETARVNNHHNYTARERHGDREMWITRKGAIKAGANDRGVIPGSMATGSYVVRGKGNPASYNSCAHGAGRRLSRNAARKHLSVDTLTERMQGKAWNTSDAVRLLDEHPDAYKDIESVMRAQDDLIEIEHSLTQVLNYKGT